VGIERMKMNKTDLIRHVAASADLSQQKAAAVLDSLFSTEPDDGLIVAQLKAGDRVSIVGFGTFEARTRMARLGRHPATGATIEIPATTVASFKPAKALKEVLAEGPRHSTWTQGA
jgi:DNA-binding protein HU-beta